MSAFVIRPKRTVYALKKKHRKILPGKASSEPCTQAIRSTAVVSGSGKCGIAVQAKTHLVNPGLTEI